MPKFSVMLGRTTVHVHEIDRDTITVGRDPEADIPIDNVSVSRDHAVFRREGDGWIVQDRGSTNGTFLNGDRVDGVRPVAPGDEIHVGKFCVVFDRAVGVAESPPLRSAEPAADATMHVKAYEIRDLVETSQLQRRAHLAWRSGSEEGIVDLEDTPAILIGTDELCDLRVPEGPKHHLLVVRDARGVEVRNLHAWTAMHVAGNPAKRVRLADGDVIEMAGVTLTFRDELRSD